MKKVFFNVISILFLMLIVISCSRDEPSIYEPPTPPPTVTYAKINELYSCGVPADPDWVEIYNPTSTAMDISGYKIYDSGGQSGSKPKMEFPANSIIPANGFLVIIVDDTASTAGFGLSSSGEKIWLENASSTIVDSVEFPALGTDTSYARKPDGSSTWYRTTPPTRNAKNDTTITIDTLVMNELYSRGVPEDPDWVEIYNPNPISVDLTGYKIYDSGGHSGSKPKKEFPSGSIIPANGFLVIVVDDADASGFGLSSSGDEVWLEKLDGTVIDNIVIPAMDVTQSYGRNPDGSTTWQLLNTITKGTSNNQ